MEVYENDQLNIPEKYKNMTITELEAEEKRLFEEAIHNRQVKPEKPKQVGNIRIKL